MLYAEWRSCERFNLFPPGVKNTWGDCNLEAQADLIAYNQIRCLEGNQDLEGLFG